MELGVNYVLRRTAWIGERGGEESAFLLSDLPAAGLQCWERGQSSVCSLIMDCSHLTIDM